MRHGTVYVVRGEPICPRCGGEVRAPGMWSSGWTCPLHGVVHPLMPPAQANADYAAHLARISQVPLWLPWPLPRGWVVSGLLRAGDDIGGIRATAVAVSGPNPLGGPADLVLIAEEPGVGLGAGLAATTDLDPGPQLDGPPHAHMEVSGHPVALWAVDSPDDRAVYAGASHGLWLWAVLRPQTAGLLIYEDLAVADLRDLGRETEVLPYDVLPAWLSGRG